MKKETLKRVGVGLGAVMLVLMGLNGIVGGRILDLQWGTVPQPTLGVAARVIGVILFAYGGLLLAVVIRGRR